MPNLPKLEEMLKAGMHFGHQAGRWHPKMEPYIFAEKNGIHIIDLEKTLVKLEQALEFIKNTASAGGIILFVGTKDQAKEIIKNKAKDCGMPYITERWLGGTLTNFTVILRLIKKYKDLKTKQESGGFKGYTKKEQLGFQEKIKKLQSKVGGIAELKKVPDVIYLVDIKWEKTARTEAAKKGIPIVAVCDTNVNPEKIDYSIPCNDDAIKSIELVTSLIAEAVKEGKLAAGS